MDREAQNFQATLLSLRRRVRVRHWLVPLEVQARVQRAGSASRRRHERVRRRLEGGSVDLRPEGRNGDVPHGKE